MKSRIFIHLIFIGIVFFLCIFSCKEYQPKGDEFAWSPDGKKLAISTLKSGELLIVDIENDHISNIKSIDNCRESKQKLYAPNWSYDGQFLLYSKSSEKSCEGYVYSVSDSAALCIARYALASKEDREKIVSPCWSPVENRILWVARFNSGKSQIISISADGTDRKLLTEINCSSILPRWSPDGQWIAYAIHIQDGHKMNGLWKMKTDGSVCKQICQSNFVTRFQWSPDGNQICLVTMSKSGDDENHQFCIINTEGSAEREIPLNSVKILNFDWSPDGKNIAFMEIADSLKNIRLIDVESLEKVKLTFNDADNYFGWSDSGQLFFSIKLPNELVKPGKAEHQRRELLNAIHGMTGENQLISLKKFRKYKLEKNVYSFKECAQNGHSAYFSHFETGFSISSGYCPAIRFSDGEIYFLARTKAEHIAAADELYLNQKYHDAFTHIGRYWNLMRNFDNFFCEFDVDSVISSMKADGDSSHFRRLLDGLNNGALLKTILILRQLEQDEKADWLFEQFEKLYRHPNPRNGRQNIFDNLSWTNIGVYGKYLEFDSGIRDLDRMLRSSENDSLFTTYILFQQTMLAFSNEQIDIALKKIKKCLEILPPDVAGLDDVLDLLLPFHLNLTSEHESVFVSTCQELIQRFSESDDLYNVYVMLGDFYKKAGKADKAAEAYQVAVTKEFDSHEIWAKIFELEVAKFIISKR